MAALALLKSENENEDLGDTFYKYRDKFNAGPMSPEYSGKTSGTKFGYDNQDKKSAKAPEERSWRKSVYDDSPKTSRNETSKNEDSRFLQGLEVPDEKNWRKAVYGPPSPSAASQGRLRRHQTEEDLRFSGAPDQQKPPRSPLTSTPIGPKRSSRDYEEEDSRPASRKQRRSQNDPDNDNRRSQQSDADSRRSQQEPESYRRSSSRDSILDDKPRRRRTRTNSRELLDEPESPRSRTALTPDTLSVRDSIEKVQSWKQTLPPSSGDHLTAVDKLKRHPETGFPRSDSGEYFSAQENAHSERGSREPELYYKDTMYAQRSPGYEPDTREEEVLSPGGRKRKVKRHLSRELSQESNVFDENETHHPVNKEKYRKSDLNRSIQNERHEKEELERRRRIYQGENPEEVEKSIVKNRKSGSSSDAFSRDDSPNRRRSRYGSRAGSREDVLEEKRGRKERYERESDSSNFGFNREGSPNRPGSRQKRRSHSRHNSSEGILDESDKHYQHTQYMRPDSMISNESLARLSAASSIPSMHSALTEDGTIQNSASMQSIVSNEVQEHPPEDNSMGSSGSLPDIVPGEKGTREQLSNNKNRKTDKGRKNQAEGFIGRMEDIDSLLNFSPNEEEFVEKGKVVEIRNQHSHLLDAPVPRQPSPMRPQNSGKYRK